VTLEEAVMLWQTMQKAHEILPSIGICPEEGEDEDEEDEEDDEEEEEDEEQKPKSKKEGDDALKCWRRGARAAWQQMRKYAPWVSTSLCLDTVAEITFAPDLFLPGKATDPKCRNINNFQVDLFDALYEQAEEAPFGDVATQTTRVDPAVRRGRELRADVHWTVTQKFCNKLAKEWCKESMLPSAVTVVPYKMSLYREGDGFAEHSDTPAPQLVGTILVGLLEQDKGWQKKHEEGAFFIRHDGLVGRWSADGGGWVQVLMFYADCPHRVEASCRRATLSFKVFHAAGTRTFDDADAWQDLGRSRTLPTATSADTPAANTCAADTRGTKASGRDVLEKARHLQGRLFVRGCEELLQQCVHGFGLVLSHGYNLNAEAFKGDDAAAWALARTIGGAKLTIVPVLIRSRSDMPDDDTEVTWTHVYALRDQDVRYVHSRVGGQEVPVPEPAVTLPDIQAKLPFFFLSREGLKVRNRVTQFVEWAGNECQPGSADSIYLHRAIIVQAAAATTSVGAPATTSAAGPVDGPVKGSKSADAGADLDSCTAPGADS
jgi:hypothetical protein